MNLRTSVRVIGAFNSPNEDVSHNHEINQDR
jgi:hypothetical protein